MLTDDNQDQSSALLNLLSLNQLPVLTNLWYHNQEVKIDGYNFVHCRFDNCRLLVSGTHFSLQRCHIDPQSVVSYMGTTIRIVKLFSARWEWAYQNAPQFAPTRHEDGTFSIQ